MKKTINIERFSIKEVILMPDKDGWQAQVLYAAEDARNKIQFAKRVSFTLSGNQATSLINSLSQMVDTIET